jgi:deoxyribonuclease-4
MKIGANVSISGNGLLSAVKETLSYKATSFMIYTRSNRGGKARKIDDLNILEAVSLLEENGLSIKDAVVHAPYYINLAGLEKAQRIGKEVLKEEIKRTEAIGIPYLVFHPGAHVGQGDDVGIENIINCLNEILTGDEQVFVCLETMAGDGSKVGNSFEDIAKIIQGVEYKKRHVLGVCMDTCHNFSFGYDIIDDLDGVLKHFDRVIGLDRLKVLHLNDSKFPMGARKDRHANIGSIDGHIPKEVLRKICNHDAFKDKPIILETPFGQYKEEISFLRGDDSAKLAKNSLK